MAQNDTNDAPLPGESEAEDLTGAQQGGSDDLVKEDEPTAEAALQSEIDVFKRVFFRK